MYIDICKIYVIYIYYIKYIFKRRTKRTKSCLLFTTYICNIYLHIYDILYIYIYLSDNQ